MKGMSVNANRVQELQDKLTEAVQGPYMICIYKVDESGTIHLYRQTNSFPKKDLSRAIDLLSSDVVKDMDFSFLNENPKE
jgi:hypothetical protein